MKIVEYSIKYKKLHQQFVKINWGKRKKGDPEYLQYKHRSINKNRIDNLIIALFGNRIVGQIGLIPTDLMLKTKKLPCYWICDLMVESEYRKKGVAIELYKYVMKRNILLIGSYPSPKAEILDRLLNLKKIKGPSLWYFPVDFKSLLKFKFQKSFKYLPATFLKVLEFLYFKCYGLYNIPFSNIKLYDWPDLFEIHDKSQSKIKEPRIIHDKTFLDWRGNGLKNYTEKLKGLKSGDDSYLFFEKGSGCLYVYDWKITSNKVAKGFSSQLVSIAKQFKKNRIQLTSNNKSQENILKKAGFKKFRDPITLYCYTPKGFSKFKKLFYSLYDSDGNI